MQLSETLRLELSPFGVDVLCLMLGTVASSSSANEPGVDLPVGSRYAVIRETISRWATGEAGPKGCSAEKLVRMIVRDVVGTDVGVVWRGPNSGTVRLYQPSPLTHHIKAEKIVFEMIGSSVYSKDQEVEN